jgi:Amt family ammonium transporter
VAGLVAITPAAGFVNVASSLIIGLGAGVICFFAVDLMKGNLGVDDALDVFAVHGVGGIWGALATGLFASTAVNPDGADGLFYGNPEQLLKQAVAVVAVAVFTAVVTAIILKVIDVTIGLRVPEQEEVLGLDTTTHGEVAYQL